MAASRAAGFHDITELDVAAAFAATAGAWLAETEPYAEELARTCEGRRRREDRRDRARVRGERA